MAVMRRRGVMGERLPEIRRPRRFGMVNQDRLARLELLANRAGGFVGVDMEQREPHPDPEEDQGQDCGPRGDPASALHHKPL